MLVDAKGTIVAGHGRVSAGKLLGMDEVPVIQLDRLSPDQIRAYIIADNRLAETAGWDNSILKIELQHLLTIEGLDITITGFDVPEIDLILRDDSEQESADDALPGPELPRVAELGGLWQLGKHRILCGDSLDSNSYERLLDGKRAATVFVDPPYNVRIDGLASGNGATHHRDFAMASGEMSSSEFVSFLTKRFKLLAQNSAEGSVQFICMDWRHLGEVVQAGSTVYDTLLNLCVWVKDNGGMGSFYRSRHELIFVYRNGGGSHRNNIQLGRFGRNRTNVWEYPGANTLAKTSGEGNLLKAHPTVKPTAMVADALLDCTKRGDLVLDSFLGSGSTLMAAERTGRVCYGIEIDPMYVDVAITRWQNATGRDAVHVASGTTYKNLCDLKEIENVR